MTHIDFELTAATTSVTRGARYPSEGALVATVARPMSEGEGGCRR